MEQSPQQQQPEQPILPPGHCAVEEEVVAVERQQPAVGACTPQANHLLAVLAD